jgi:hypothetical protein
MLGFLFTFLIFLFGPVAHANIVFSQSSGASAVDLSIVGKPIIYGGFAGTCSESSSTCNTCTGESIGMTGLVPCNPNNVMSTTNLSIVFTSTKPILEQPQVHINNSTGLSVGNVSWTAGSTSFTVTSTWGDICNKAPTNADSDCKKDIDLDLYVSVGSNTGGTTNNSAYMTVKIVTHYVDTSIANIDGWKYTDCPADDLNSDRVGFCHFEAFSGDGKIYANNLSVGSSFPATSNSSARYKNLVFFYEIQTDADLATGDPDAATLERITNASNSFFLGVDTATSPPVADSRIDGLENGYRYCMVMASQDVTGMINFFTPISGTTPTPVLSSTLCTTPEPVVGLLDDKSCFIATAAFGSDMAPEVQVLRLFRNKFLLTNGWGKRFVKAYYKYSPTYARMISGRENIKSVVRAMLHPVLLFANLSLSLGLWFTFCILSLVIFVPYGLYRFFRRRKECGGQL